MRTASHSAFAALVASVFLVTTLSGCTRDEVPATYNDEASAPYSAQDCLDLLAVATYDYDPAPSPSALADHSELVVTATIDRVQEGRIEIMPGSEGTPVGSTMVLVLRDPRAVLGNSSEGSDGFVYVELPALPGIDADGYQDGPCTGAKVVAYLGPAAAGETVEGVDTAVDEPSAGRPVGQALYIPAGPQALILQFDDETLVWPLIGEQREGTLADTLPNGMLIAP